MTYANDLELYMLELVNDERTSRGLHELQLEINLNSAAEDHSSWMLDVNIFSHTGVDGSTPTQRIVAAGFDYTGARGTSENIAVQSSRGPEGFFDDVEDLHIALMNSPGHLENILSTTREYIGIGIEIGTFTYPGGFTAESVMITQNFGRTQGTVDLDSLTGTAAAPVVAESDPVAQTFGNQTLQGAGTDDMLVGSDGHDTVSGGGRR